MTKMKKKAKRKPAKKRPVLYVEAFQQGGILSWYWSVTRSLTGEWLFESSRPYSSERKALADARRVLGRYCAECDVRFPK